MQVPSVMIRGGELLDFSVPEMEGITHVKTKKVLDRSVEIRGKIKEIVVC